MTNGWTDSTESMIEQAWVIIANVGDWNQMPDQWREAAEDWRERYHRYLGRPRNGKEGT